VLPALSFWAVALVGAGVVVGCQKQADLAPYAPACQTDCKPPQIVAIGTGTVGGGTTTPTPDAGFDAGTLTGNVVELNEATFSQATAFTQMATVAADGATGTSVSGNWDGTNPYTLSGVAVEVTNWVSVTPNAAQGDALQTFQAVETDATDTANLAVVNSAVIDGILLNVSATRAPALGQVVMFFRNAGTGEALSGVRAVMNASEAPAYAATSGWVLMDDTTVTDSSGLVMFGNVDLPATGSTTQTVTITRPATATTAAISGGTFAVRVAGGAVTIATVGVQL
jgi:hypothetical protein